MVSMSRDVKESRLYLNQQSASVHFENVGFHLNTYEVKFPEMSMFHASCRGLTSKVALSLGSKSKDPFIVLSAGNEKLEMSR